jgi:hypothetical protein
MLVPNAQVLCCRGFPLIQHDVPPQRWVLSGPIAGWGDALIPSFDLVVFLHVPTVVRLARLQRSERAGAANPRPHVASYSSRVDGLILNQQSDQAKQLLMLWTSARAQECPDLDVSDMTS